MNIYQTIMFGRKNYLENLIIDDNDDVSDDDT